MTSRSADGGGAARKRPWLPSKARQTSSAVPPVAASPVAVPAATAPAPSAPRAEGLGVRRVNHAWLVHPTAVPDRRSLLFAAGLAADPEYALVVVDLPDNVPPEAVEEAVARAVPAGPGGLRVVFGRAPARGATPAGIRLARRLGQHVVVPDGLVRPSAGGALFIGADRGRGWVLCTPEGQVHYVSRRFPRPGWDGNVPGRPGPVGPAAVAEPVGAGVWVRPVLEDTSQHRHRGLLASRLRCRTDAPTVVVGTPGSPMPATADLAHFLRGLRGSPESTAAAPRLVFYGPAQPVGDPPPAGVLAALTGEPVHVTNGFPTGDPLVGRPSADQVLLLAADGTPGRPVLAREFLHLPPEALGPSHPPLATDHRWPLDHLPMLRQGLHHGGSGTVLEVLPWGLWIRPSTEPPHADEVREAPAHPHHELVLCDDGVPEALPRLRRIADDVLRRLPAGSAPPVRVRTGARPWRIAVGAETGADGAGRPEAATAPAGPMPAHPVSRRDTALVARALWQEPGIGGLLPRETVLAGLTAVRLRLTAAAGAMGGAGRFAVPSEVEPSALAALSLLPFYDGVVALRVDLDPSVLRRYREERVASAYSVCAASLTGTPGRPGNTDVLISSATGRRTALLEPEAPDRVLFTPGTRFDVLDVRARPGERAVVMLGELPPAGFCGTGRTGASALRDLEAALRIWRQDEECGMVRGPVGDPFAVPPMPEVPGDRGAA